MYERSFLKSSYKLKDGYSCCEFGGEFVAVANGEEMADPSRVVFMNERCVFLWGLLAGGAVLEEMKTALMRKFGTDDEEAEADVGEFIAKLKHAGMVE